MELEFTCEGCNEIFEKAWSDEEAQAEFKNDWPESYKTGGKTSLFCDDCYEEWRGSFQ